MGGVVKMNQSEVKTVKTWDRSNFEEITTQYIQEGYIMFSAGYRTSQSRDCWWAVMVKKESGALLNDSHTLEEAGKS